MKHLLLLGILFFGIALSAAPKWTGSGGWGGDSPHARMFDPDTVESLEGEVVAVEEIVPEQGMRHGIHVTLSSGGERLSVHLGPSWFLLNQDVQIREGDRVLVEGSRVTISGKQAIIASRVVKDGQQLRLRDSKGTPVWAGWRRAQ